MSAFEAPTTADKIHEALQGECDPRDRDPQVPSYDSDVYERPFWALARTVAELVGDENIEGMWSSRTGEGIVRDYRVDVFTAKALVTGQLTMKASEQSSEETIAPDRVSATRRRITDVRTLTVASSSKLRHAPGRGVDAEFDSRSVHAEFEDGHTVTLEQSFIEQRREGGIDGMLKVFRSADL